VKQLTVSEALAAHAKAAYDLGQAQAIHLSATDPERMTVLVQEYETALAALDRALGREPTVPMTAPVGTVKVSSHGERLRGRVKEVRAGKTDEELT
jgi:hypothetical protein